MTTPTVTRLERLADLHTRCRDHAARAEGRGLGDRAARWHRTASRMGYVLRRGVGAPVEVRGPLGAARVERVADGTYTVTAPAVGRMGGYGRAQALDVARSLVTPAADA